MTTRKEVEDFKIRIYVQGIGLEVLITAQDPSDLLIMSAAIVASLRQNNMEPTIEIQP